MPVREEVGEEKGEGLEGSTWSFVLTFSLSLLQVGNLRGGLRGGLRQNIHQFSRCALSGSCSSLIG